MDDLTEQQHRFLTQLAAAGGTALLKDIKRKPPSDRKPLIEARLVEEGKEGRSLAYTLTGLGRARIADHPAPPKKVTKPKAKKIPGSKKKPPKPDEFPEPGHRLILLRLAFSSASEPGTGSASNLSPAKQRSELVAHGLLEQLDRRGRTQFFGLTEKGWKWMEDHFGEPFGGTGMPETVLREVLGRASGFLAARGLRLADLIRAKAVSPLSPPEPVIEGGAKPSSPSAASDPHIKDLIGRTCVRLGGGQVKQRIRLADLRRELGETDRAVVDRALLELAELAQIVLYPMDDPRKMGQEDRDAEFRTPAGSARHIVYWTGHSGVPVTL